MKKVTCKLTVVSDGISKVITANKGDNIREVLISNGYFINSPCSGKGTCGKCRVKINSKTEKSCLYTVTDDAVIELESENNINFETINKTYNIISDAYLALDIGTTTLALALVLSNGKIAEIASCYNPQMEYGADIISRIDAVAKGKLFELKSAVVLAINRMIKSLREKNKITKISKMYVSGNMTMLHILLGIDCTSMGVAPYEATFLDSKSVDAHNLGIDFDNLIVTMPGIHAFAGGDIVAGLSILTPPVGNRCVILIDLGTNAEIAIMTRDRILCTSTAAGPCFEGVNLSCGMSAHSGAVVSFQINNGAHEYTTVGNTLPKGICGTGLIDVIAQMIKNNLIDKTGLIINSDKFEVCKGVYITQQDIREFQLAKSAIESGVETLMQIANVKPDNVSNVYFSGGFSEKINTENAAFCGLIQSELSDKCVSIGNSSLRGAAEYESHREIINEIVKKAEYVDLSLNENFSQRFMENMYL